MAGNDTSNPVGRPTVMSDEVLRKLNEAFAFGASDKEACFYADIAPATLYKYQDVHPEFVERKDLLKERPILLARQSVIRGLENDPHLSLKYLERKRRKEFALRQEVGVDTDALKDIIAKYGGGDNKPIDELPTASP